MLVLGGSAASTLTGLGMQFTGFTNLTESSGAEWTLAGVNILNTGTTLTVNGDLSVAGSVADAGILAVAPTGAAVTVLSGAAEFASITLLGGTLAESTPALFVVGTSLADAEPGTILLDSGATISGFGTMTAPGLIDNGTITAQEGTLTLNAIVSGDGSAVIQPGATLLVSAGIRLASLAFAGPDAILRITPYDLSTTITGFGTNDTIDLENTHATSLSFNAGTLTLSSGQHVIDRPRLAGDYTTADFILTSNGHNGTDIHFADASTTQSPFVKAPLQSALLRNEAFAGMHPHARFG
jgi:hypothetical protein